MDSNKLLRTTLMGMDGNSVDTLMVDATSEAVLLRPIEIVRHGIGAKRVRLDVINCPTTYGNLPLQYGRLPKRCMECEHFRGLHDTEHIKCALNK